MWNRNFMPAVVQARELVASGAIGSPVAIHVDFFFSKDAGPPKGSRRSDEPKIDWLKFQLQCHRDHSDGGLALTPMGELQIEGIYPLAYIRTIMGAEVRSVFARTASHFHQVSVDHQVEDLATLSLELDGGILGSLCIGRIGVASHPDLGEIKIHVLGENGGLVISEARPEVAIYYRDQIPTEHRHLRVAIDNDFMLMENFGQAIDNGAPTILDAQASRAICAVVHSALESARLEIPVEVPRAVFRSKVVQTAGSN
jgi:predicted dehydrogenase